MLECGRQGYKNRCCNRRPAFQNGFPGRGREGASSVVTGCRMWEVLSPSLWNTPLKKEEHGQRDRHRHLRDVRRDDPAPGPAAFPVTAVRMRDSRAGYPPAGSSVPAVQAASIYPSMQAGQASRWHRSRAVSRSSQAPRASVSKASGSGGRPVSYVHPAFKAPPLRSFAAFHGPEGPVSAPF